MDLACKLRRREALAALDALARECGVTIGEMNALLRRYRRRRGVVQARELAQLADPRSESSGESWSRLEIHDHDLPTPQARVVVEYDGEEFHTGPADRTADEARRDWLRRNGWYVIVLTKDSSPTRRCEPGRPNCAPYCGNAA